MAPCLIYSFRVQIHAKPNPVEYSVLFCVNCSTADSKGWVSLQWISRLWAESSIISCLLLSLQAPEAGFPLCHLYLGWQGGGGSLPVIALLYVIPLWEYIYKEVIVTFTIHSLQVHLSGTYVLTSCLPCNTRVAATRVSFNIQTVRICVHGQ